MLRTPPPPPPPNGPPEGERSGRSGGGGGGDNKNKDRARGRGGGAARSRSQTNRGDQGDGGGSRARGEGGRGPPAGAGQGDRGGEGAGGRPRASSGTVWEDLAGYSRAVRVGDRILVSGPTATHGRRVIGGDDPGAQATFCLDKIQGAIESLGGTLDDVVRTRVFVADVKDWEPVSRAHGRRFGRVRPANTLVQAALIGAGYLVEIEAEAVVG